MSCENACYEAFVSSCNDIIIRAAFTPNYPMYWLVQRACSNNLKQKLTQTNADGDLIISEDDLPDGFLCAGRQIKIEVRDGSNYLQPILFEFGGNTFQCILAKLTSITKDDTDDSDVNVIQFTEAVAPENTGITFIANANFTIPLAALKTLDYITLANPATMNVTIGITPGGTELADQEVTVIETITLNHTPVADETIYVEGILPGTTVKFKKS